MIHQQVPLDPSRQTARDWALRELSGREYRNATPGPVQRLLSWLGDRLSEVSLPSGTGSAIASAILLVLIGLVIAYAVSQSGGLGRQARRRAAADVFAEDGPRSPQEHRDAADRAAGAGHWRTAVLERFRCVVRELEERAVVAAQPGRTAAETARDAAVVLPALGDRLTAAARVFDDVRYGGRGASRSQDDALRALDDAVRSARVSIP